MLQPPTFSDPTVAKVENTNFSGHALDMQLSSLRPSWRFYADAKRWETRMANGSWHTYDLESSNAATPVSAPASAPEAARGSEAVTSPSEDRSCL